MKPLSILGTKLGKIGQDGNKLRSDHFSLYFFDVSISLHKIFFNA